MFNKKTAKKGELVSPFLLEIILASYRLSSAKRLIPA